MDGNLANVGAAEGAHMDVGDRRGESSQTQQKNKDSLKKSCNIEAYRIFYLTTVICV